MDVCAPRLIAKSLGRHARRQLRTEARANVARDEIQHPCRKRSTCDRSSEVGSAVKVDPRRILTDIGDVRWLFGPSLARMLRRITDRTSAR